MDDDREYWRYNQEWTIQRIPKVQSRMDNPENTEGAIKNGQSREYWRCNQEWTIQRIPKVQLRMDNPENTEGAIKNGQSVFSGLSILDCTFGILWIVYSWLPLQIDVASVSGLFIHDCPFRFMLQVSQHKSEGEIMNRQSRDTWNINLKGQSWINNQETLAT
jgi:hypothetical protein